MELRNQLILNKIATIGNLFYFSVNDVNDNSPVFNLSEVRIDVSRTELVGAVVGHVTASDEDIGNNALIVYK